MAQPVDERSRIRTLCDLFCIPLGLFLLAGCTYLHDPGRQAMAEQAQAEFADAVKDPPYSAETSRFLVHGARIERISRDLHALEDSVQLNSLTSRKWSDLSTDTKNTKEGAADSLELAREGKLKEEERLQTALEQLPGVKKTVSDLNAAIEKAEDAALRFEATQILLRESLGIILDSEKSGSLAALRATLEEKVPGAGGKTVADVLDLQTRELTGLADKKSLNPADLELVNEIIDLASSLPDVHRKLNFEAPGIATMVVGLSLDVARAEQLRLTAEVDFAKRTNKHHEQHVDMLDKYVAALDRDLDPDNSRSFAKLAKTSMDAGDCTVRDTLTRLGLAAQRAKAQVLAAATAGDERQALDVFKTARGTLRSAYAIIATNFEIRVLDRHEVDLFGDRTAALEAQRQLRVTMVNLSEREALISRGLEGLVEFHRGGITAEDINNLLQLAQAIGIGIISGNV